MKLTMKLNSAHVSDSSLRSPPPGKTSRIRLLSVLAMLGVAAVLLMWRALDIQVLHREFLQEQGDARHLRVVNMPAHRGMIADRNGEPLAISTPVDSVWASPREFLAARKQWPRLMGLLHLDAVTLQRHLAKRVDREFIYLKRAVSPELARQVMALGVPHIGQFLINIVSQLVLLPSIKPHLTFCTLVPEKAICVIRFPLEMACISQLMVVITGK